MFIHPPDIFTAHVGATDLGGNEMPAMDWFTAIIGAAAGAVFVLLAMGGIFAIMEKFTEKIAGPDHVYYCGREDCDFYVSSSDEDIHALAVNAHEDWHTGVRPGLGYGWHEEVK